MTLVLVGRAFRIELSEEAALEDSRAALMSEATAGPDVETGVPRLRHWLDRREILDAGTATFESKRRASKNRNIWNPGRYELLSQSTAERRSSSLDPPTPSDFGARRVVAGYREPNPVSTMPTVRRTIAMSNSRLRYFR